MMFKGTIVGTIAKGHSPHRVSFSKWQTLKTKLAKMLIGFLSMLTTFAG